MLTNDGLMERNGDIRRGWTRLPSLWGQETTETEGEDETDGDETTDGDEETDEETDGDERRRETGGGDRGHRTTNDRGQQIDTSHETADTLYAYAVMKMR